MDSDNEKWVTIAVAIVLVVVAVVAVIISVVGISRVNDYQKETSGLEAVTPADWTALGGDGSDSLKSRAAGVFHAAVAGTVASVLCVLPIAYVVFTFFGAGALTVYALAMLIVAITWGIFLYYLSGVGEARDFEGTELVAVEHPLFSIANGILALQLVHALGGVLVAAYFVLAPRQRAGYSAAPASKDESVPGAGRRSARDYWSAPAPAAASPRIGSHW